MHQGCHKATNYHMFSLHRYSSHNEERDGRIVTGDKEKETSKKENNEFYGFALLTFLCIQALVCCKLTPCRKESSEEIDVINGRLREIIY